MLYVIGSNHSATQAVWAYPLFFPFSHRRSSDMEGQLRHTHSRHSTQRPVDETRRLDYPHSLHTTSTTPEQLAVR